VLVVGGAGIALLTRTDSEVWLSRLPTTPLLVVERILSAEASPMLQREVDERIDGGLTAGQAELIIPGLIEQLGADGHDWNAHRVMDLLRSLGPAAIPHLQEALRSSDWQRRQLAATLLRGPRFNVPTDDLLRVTVEGLRDDMLPYDSTGSRPHTTWIDNANDGFQYLLDHADGVDRFLAEGMATGDAQQRFLCAAVAGITGKAPLMDAAVPILTRHLCDNDVANDAALAAGALFRFGPPVASSLEPLLNSEDRQQRDLAQLILLDLQGPPKTRAEKDARRRLNRATDHVADPAVELYIGRVGF